jgi:NTP pyrophosphatase (non-canonical NTP hydrolase)
MNQRTAVPVTPKPLTLDEYQARTQDTAVYPGQGDIIGLLYVALKMNGEAGEFAEHVGKAIRDDNLLSVANGPESVVLLHELTPARTALLKKEIGDVLWYLAAGARELGFTLSDIAQENLNKLADRKARGVLAGSGDLR